MLFESNGKSDDDPQRGGVMSGRRKRAKGSLGLTPGSRGRFQNAEPTIWNGEDLDIPTFIRKDINLDL